MKRMVVIGAMLFAAVGGGVVAQQRGSGAQAPQLEVDALWP